MTLVKKTDKNQVYVARVDKFRFIDTNRLKVIRWKNIYHVNSNNKKAGMCMLV